ncbi:MAG: N-acetylneuraminate synthase family protein [Gemmatimonadota bacterium]|nr:N-acetylneuraminate synthase family protein [Gemmatimonadota bacterium]
MTSFKLGKKMVGLDHPTYFVADISANHDGSLERAKLLIRLCAEAGANAAKFQNFRAAHIVSDRGFKELGGQMSHQAKWKKSVFSVYQGAELPWEWTEDLKKECDAAGIDYFSAPYDLEAVEMLDPYVELFKIGSGDITWPEMLEAVALRNKPVLLATGASELSEVERAVETILRINKKLVLMQCNTNYTASLENFRHVHLRALATFATRFPNTILGLSDHTPGHATTLGAVTLGARVIEKHFTDDNAREGPDHPFSMTPVTWRDMVDRTRELEYALGSTDKFVADNEKETVVVQRRSLRAVKDLKAGTVLTAEMLEPLRPAPRDAVFPYQLSEVVGKRLSSDLPAGAALTKAALSNS